MRKDFSKIVLFITLMFHMKLLFITLIQVGLQSNFEEIFSH